jgi:predicted GNAT family acetyltransferase
VAAGGYFVRDNPEEHRYEILRDGELLGEILYRTEPGVVVLVHTEVAPSAEGEGIGSRLVGGALEDIRSRGLRVVPLCPFVAGYIRRHPEQRDLVVRDPAIPE